VQLGVESSWVHSALRPLIGLLCQPRVIMMMEKLVEWLAGETEGLEENLPQCRFIHHKPHMLPATNRLSYCTAYFLFLFGFFIVFSYTVLYNCFIMEPEFWSSGLQNPPGYRMDARLTTLPCKKKIVAESEEVNTGWSNSRQIWQSLLRKALTQKGLFC
jgi:hypothetical protein